MIPTGKDVANETFPEFSYYLELKAFCLKGARNQCAKVSVITQSLQERMCPIMSYQQLALPKTSPRNTGHQIVSQSVLPSPPAGIRILFKK